MLASRVGLKRLTMIIMAMNAITIGIFGQITSDLNTLTWVAIAVGFFGNAAISGMYSICRRRLPNACPRHRHRLCHSSASDAAVHVLIPWLAGTLLTVAGKHGRSR